MRCCVITPYPPDMCGVAIYSRSLVSELSKHVEVSVVANQTDGPSVEHRDGAKVVRCWRRHTLTCFLKMFWAVAHEHPDVIHVQHEYLVYGARKYSALFPLLLILLRLLRRPVVVTMHSVILLDKATGRFFYEHGVGRRFASLKRGLTAFVTRLIGLLSDAVIVHKHLMKKALVEQYGFDKDKIRVIPHGVYPPKTVRGAKRKLGLKGHVILFSGFVIPGKGVEQLIEAFSKLLARGVDAVLVIAGRYHPRLRLENPWYLGSVERAIEKSGLHGRVIFLNRFLTEEELNLYLSAADVVVLPYTDDSIIGASGVLVRSVATGKPVVATSIPRFLEDLADGLNVLLVKPRDVDGLVRAIGRILRNPRLGRETVKAVEEWVSERAWKNVALKTVRVYEELVGTRGYYESPEGGSARC